KIALLVLMLALSAVIGFTVLRGSWSSWPWAVRGYAVLCLTVALVGLPAATLVRALRRCPGGILERLPEHVDVAANEGAESLIGPGRYSWLLHLPGNESLRLHKRGWDVALSTLPEAWDGLSIVHISDLHFAPCFRPRYFERVIEEAAMWEADLVLFTGD